VKRKRLLLHVATATNAYSMIRPLPHMKVDNGNMASMVQRNTSFTCQ